LQREPLLLRLRLEERTERRGLVEVALLGVAPFLCDPSEPRLLRVELVDDRAQLRVLGLELTVVEDEQHRGHQQQQRSEQHPEGREHAPLAIVQVLPEHPHAFEKWIIHRRLRS
jgi:hypothetical protein